MSVHHYYPRLKWKPAEWESLQELSTSVLEGLTPIFTVLDIDWDYDNDDYKKTIADHLSGFGATLSSSWPLDRPVLVDAEYVDKHGTSAWHPIDDLTQDAIQSGKSIIPVYSPHYSYNYLSAVQRNSQNGIALRLKYNDILRGNYNILAILGNLGISPQSVDLIIDLEDIQTANPIQQQLTHVYANYLSVTQWRNIIISSTCYPTSLGGIPQKTPYLHAREEWNLWTNLIQANAWIKTPSFSDYPTSASTITNIDPRVMSQTVAVRYSNQTSWIFVKGSPVKGNGWGHTEQLCRTLLNSGLYFNPQYSWGDKYIQEREQLLNGPGGPKAWKKVAHTHHLTLVVEQLIHYSQQFPAFP